LRRIINGQLSRPRGGGSAAQNAGSKPRIFVNALIPEVTLRLRLRLSAIQHEGDVKPYATTFRSSAAGWDL